MSLLAGQSEGCAPGATGEEEERQGGSAVAAPGGAACDAGCSRGGVGDGLVPPGQAAGSTSQLLPEHTGQLLPGKEQSAGSAGHAGGEGVPAPRGSTGAGSSPAGAESGTGEGAPPRSHEAPPSLELLCCAVERLSPGTWAEERVQADEDEDSLQQHREEEEEEEEGGLRSSSPKPGQASTETQSHGSPGGEESWDALFNDDGDCLDPRLLEEVSSASRWAWGWLGGGSGLCPWGAAWPCSVLALPATPRGRVVPKGPGGCCWELLAPAWTRSPPVPRCQRGPVKAGGDLPFVVHKVHPVKRAREP